VASTDERWTRLGFRPPTARSIVEPGNCRHEYVDIINPYEFVRKFRCQQCREVMMCSCSEAFGRIFVPYQLDETREIRTAKPVKVTLGFVNNVCNLCRGLPEDPAPRADGPRSGSKVRRYYSRELYMESMLRFAEWCLKEARVSSIEQIKDCQRQHADILSNLEKQVLAEIKTLHQESPKYMFAEDRADKLLAELAVEVINLAGTYIKGAGRHKPLFFDGHRGNPEDLAAAYFTAQGYSVLHIESRPFHALFGSMMWIWVQDYADPENRVVGFGREYRGEDLGLVLCVLPPDFGLPGHAERRGTSLEEHLQNLPDELSEMLWLFDYWHDYAREFCLYLYGYEPDIVSSARKVIQVLGTQTVRRILRYLASAYWERYLGWPDLLVFQGLGKVLVCLVGDGRVSGRPG
jgi:hypothetical protein